MKISSIIAEYNPLHNGHLYHINKTKEETNSDAIICIMSGNYVQRGIPAIIDKWNRAKAALECGVDLVLELPVLYSVSSAEFFAYGSVSLLNSLGVVDSICFGSELGDIECILSVAEVLNDEPEEFKKLLKDALNTGLPYPSARNIALSKYLPHNSHSSNELLNQILGASNNILAVEYCKSLLKLGSNIKPFTIKRQGGTYNSSELNNIFSSATSIRKYLKNNIGLKELQNHIPHSTFDLLCKIKNENYDFVFPDSMINFLRYKYFTTSSDITKLPDVSEGLHNKIYKSLINAVSYDDLIENIKSKRYTYTRISRILCQYFIGFEEYDTRFLRTQSCPYARILGFNEKGTEILKKIKAHTSIPVLTKVPRELPDVFKLDIRATNSYSLLSSTIKPNSDYLTSPIKVGALY